MDDKTLSVKKKKKLIRKRSFIKVFQRKVKYEIKTWNELKQSHILL